MSIVLGGSGGGGWDWALIPLVWGEKGLSQPKQQVGCSLQLCSQPWVISSSTSRGSKKPNFQQMAAGLAPGLLGWTNPYWKLVTSVQDVVKMTGTGVGGEGTKSYDYLQGLCTKLQSLWWVPSKPASQGLGWSRNQTVGILWQDSAAAQNMASSTPFGLPHLLPRPHNFASSFILSPEFQT